MNAVNDVTQSVHSDRKKGFEIPKVIAIILAVLLGIFTVIGLLCFNVWSVLFNPPLVKQTLTEEVLSSDLVPATLEVFSEWRARQRVENKESLSGVNEPDIVLLMSFLDGDNWREIKKLLVTDELVVSIINDSVDGLYAWIDSSQIWPDIQWNMAPFKERMNGQEGIDAIMIAYSALPEATDEDIADFKRRLSQVPPGVKVLYNLCQFPDPWHDDQVADYMDALHTANDNIPMVFHFSDEFGRSASELNLMLAKSQLRMIRFIALAGWIFALLLLALIFILKVRTLRSMGKYVGIPLLTGGALAIIIALLGQTVLVGMITKTLLSATSDFARQEITGSLERLSEIFFQPLLVQGIVLAGLGIIMIALIFVMRSKIGVKESASPEATAI